MLKDQKIYCLQAQPCIFQPRNFTGWGSEGVKRMLKHLFKEALDLATGRQLRYNDIRENEKAKTWPDSHICCPGLYVCGIATVFNV